MGKAWPGARKVDRLKAKRKERGGEVTGGRKAVEAAQARLAAAKRVSSADAAAILGMTHPQVLVAITAGRLVGRRDGGRFWVDSASVRARLEETAKADAGGTD